MAGSSAPLRRLGAELRRLREATGRTQVDVGAEIGRSHATLVNWESGKTKISKSDLVCLLAELRAPTELRKGLEQLRREANQGTSQWAVYGLPDWLRPLLSFEEDATTVETFEPVIIPGLLQTEEYAQAIHLAGPHIVSPNDVDRWVTARMHRQQRLFEPEPLRLRAVISEAALRLQVGDRELMATQLEQLSKAAQADNITIQVLPSSQASHAGIASNLTLLHFADPAVDPPLAYFDGPLGGHMISDEGDVAAMIKLHEDLRSPALDPDDSAAMIAAILEELR